jgi:hypothetical protein
MRLKSKDKVEETRRRKKKLTCRRVSASPTPRVFFYPSSFILQFERRANVADRLAAMVVDGEV